MQYGQPQPIQGDQWSQNNMMNPQMMNQPYGQIPPQGNQIYPPMNFAPNPQVDGVIAAGFGDMFFNMNDPNIAKTNVPLKQDSSMHTAVIVGSVLFLAGIVVGGVGHNKFLFGYQTGLVIGLPYLAYLICAICLSDIRGYITNLKKFD